jgi:site-specific DNA-adenine methylase
MNGSGGMHLLSVPVLDAVENELALLGRIAEQRSELVNLKSTTRFSTAFAMPSRWTFSMPPVAEFLARHLDGCVAIVDPFCGESTIAHYRNDLARGGIRAELFVCTLRERVKADAVIFDPPYSPRQIAECYKSVGQAVTPKDTQNGRLYREVRAARTDILVPGGVRAVLRLAERRIRSSLAHRRNPLGAARRRA